jgi:nucleoside phosphorylase
MILLFSQVSNQDQAWQDLHRLTHDNDNRVRLGAINAVVSLFSQVSNQDQAWQDLISLTQDKDDRVRFRAINAVISLFSQVPDKAQAWQDLNRLTHDNDNKVRLGAINAVVSLFSQVPDKAQAWQDLFRLTQDEASSVRESAAYALGTAFGQVPDKDRAWQDLIRLTQDRDRDVRMNAYHSLGRASVFKAIKTDDRGTLKKELETAVAFFEKSSHESAYSPARFCGPFYRSYFAVIFQEAKEEEVKKYLAVAKQAVGGSKCKDELLKAVDNLAGALRETQRLKDRPLHEVASELDAYRRYCDKAAEHMIAAEDKASGAVKLMRKGTPLLEERIQATIAEIQEKAKQICRITRESSTEFEAPGAEIYRAAKGLSKRDLISIQRSSSSIVKQLKKFCRQLPEEEKDQVFEVVGEIEFEADFAEKLHLIDRALFNLEYILGSHRMPLIDIVILTVLQEEYNGVLTKLSSLSLPQDMGPNIYAWRFGKVFCTNYNRSYKVAVGMIGRAGNSQSALAAKEAVSLWRPNYLIFSGIAGGLPASDLKKGDVIIADCIYGYEYGKVEEGFKPRGNWAYKTDQGLMNGAVAYSLQDSWRYRIKSKPPEECKPKIVSGEIASGEKVIEDPTNKFFTQVLKMWPKVKAVEMEGAGIGSAIEQAQSLKIPVGFMVIRAISDLPRLEGEGDRTRGTEERDAWKAYASDAAAAFIMGWITEGLPLPPSA